jgi:hypothetical protein
MIRNLTLLLFTLTTTLLFAQSKADFGPLIEIEDRGYLPKIVGESKDELYGIDYQYETIFLETFNKTSLASKMRKEIEIEELKRVTEKLVRITYINGEIVYFTSLYDYRNDRFSLIAQTIDPSKGEIISRKELFDKPVDKGRHRGAYFIYVSKNRKRLLMRTKTYYKDKDRSIENLVLFNDKLELITEREYSVKGNNVNTSSDLLVDDEGSIYFFQNGEIVILDAFNDFEEWREELPSDNLILGSFYSQVTISLNNDLDPVITAFYVTKDLEDQDRKEVNKSRSNRKEGDTQVEGIVFFKINSLDKELEVVKQTSFEADFVDLFKSEDDIYNNYDPEIENVFRLNRIFNLENGEVFLAAEVYQRYVSQDQNGSVIGVRYMYNDMMLIHFSSDGTILWKDRLPKMQMYYWGKSILGYGGSSGYSFLNFPKGVDEYFFDKLIVKDKKVFIIYNDMPENRAGNSYTQELEVFKKFKKGVPVVQTIDLEEERRNGEMVPNLTKMKFWLKPNSIYESKLNDDVFYFVTYKKKMHLAKTSFQ